METKVQAKITLGKIRGEQNTERSIYVTAKIKEDVIIIKHKHIVIEAIGKFDVKETENIIMAEIENIITELKKKPRDYIDIVDLLEKLINNISKTQDIKQIIINTGKYINFIYCVTTFLEIFRNQGKSIDIEVDYNHPISHKWFVLRGKHKIYMEHSLFIDRGETVSSYTPLKEIYCDRINEVRDNFETLLEAIQ